MKISMMMAATALGLTMALSGAMAASTMDKSQTGAQTDTGAQTGTQGTTGAQTGAQTGTSGAIKMDDGKVGADVKTGAGATTGATATNDELTKRWYSVFKADDLEDKTVRNQAGEDVGEIDDIVRDADGEYYAVLEVGGFLGIGEKHVLVPLSRMMMGEDEVILLSTEDEEQLKSMPAYDDKVEGYTEIEGNQSLGM